jgi:hypothetical protein
LSVTPQKKNTHLKNVNFITYLVYILCVCTFENFSEKERISAESYFKVDLKLNLISYLYIYKTECLFVYFVCKSTVLLRS